MAPVVPFCSKITCDNSTANTYIKKKCRICNQKGKRGNKLITCVSCGQDVHCKICSSKYINTKNINSNSNVDSVDEYVCTYCKAKRKSGSIPPPSSSGPSGNSSQSKNAVSGRGSLSSTVTPLVSNTCTLKRNKVRDIPPTSDIAIATSKDAICNIPSHLDIQRQIDKINDTIHELNVLYTNNNMQVIYLKQENQRLTELIYSLQNQVTASANTSTSVFQNPMAINIPKTDAGSSAPESSIFNYNLSKNNEFITNFSNNNICSSLNNINNNNVNTNLSNNFDKTNNTSIHYNNNLLSSHNFNNNNNNYFSHKSNTGLSNNFYSKSNSKSNFYRPRHLIHCNNIITNNFQKSSNLMTCSSNQVKNHTTIDRLTPPSITNAIADSITDAPVERREIFIPGFMRIDNITNLRRISYAILKAFYPSLDEGDICGVRFTSTLITASHEQGCETKFPSFINTLNHPDLVQLIMRAKKLHGYLTTKDINLLHHNSELASALLDRKIFINEVLSTIEQHNYFRIKDTAKSLGFKFVWHCNGRFLVRMRQETRSHEINTVNDLYTISLMENKIRTVPNCTNIPTNSLSEHRDEI